MYMTSVVFEVISRMIYTQLIVGVRTFMRIFATAPLCKTMPPLPRTEYQGDVRSIDHRTKRVACRLVVVSPRMPPRPPPPLVTPPNHSL